MAPNPRITSVAWPSSPKETGDQCGVTVYYRNDGSDGDMFSRVVDSAGNVLDSYTSSIAAGETSADSLYFNMPSRDITIYAQVGTSTTVTDQRGPYPIEHAEEPVGWEPLTIYRGIQIWVWMPAGEPFTAYFDGSWHSKSRLSRLKDAIDDFLGPEEPGGNFDVTGIVTPAKAGFLVEFWWGTTVDNMFLADDKTTGSDGKVHWRPWSSIWPMKVQLKIPAGQVVDGVEYGYAESGILTAWKGTEANLYLYPEAVVPAVAGHIEEICYWIAGMSTWEDLETYPYPAEVGDNIHIYVRWINDGSSVVVGHVLTQLKSPLGYPYLPDAVVNQDRSANPGGGFAVQFAPVALNESGSWEFFGRLDLAGTFIDSKKFTFAVEEAPVGIPTTTTITAPDRVDAGEIFTVYGNLYETETGILIPGMRINISYNGKSLGYGYTGPEGDYYIDVSINEGGVWTIKSEFPGTEALQTSRSLTDAVVTDSPLTVALLTAGPITTGLALFIYGTS